MTLPSERIRANKYALDFIRRIFKTKRNGGYDGIPRHVREEALRICRHLCSGDMFDYYFEHRKEK